MSSRFVVFLEIVLASCTPLTQVKAHPLPGDVAAFVQRRIVCDHFRGEEPYDQARAAEIKTKLAEACTGTDKELAKLRRKYAADRQVARRLSRYEDRVE